MDLILGQKSSLEFLRSDGYGVGRRWYRLSRLAELPAGTPPAAALRKPFACLLEDPIDILVSSAGDRRKMPGCSFHVWSASLPRGSLLRIGAGVHACSPEFAFLLLAGQTDLLELIEIGCELCGYYYRAGQPAADDEAGSVLCDLETPLTSRSRIAAFLERADGLRGVALARRAIAHVLDRSRSPQETRLALSLTLPHRFGGQNVKHIELNHSIPLGELRQRTAGQQRYEIDLYSPRGPVGLEYHSRAYHSGQERVERDLRRESIIEDMGVPIHVVTGRQARDALEVIRLAKTVKRAQGERWRGLPPGHIQKTRALLEQLHLQGQHPKR